jgi:di/tricarboxylate transporter
MSETGTKLGRPQIIGGCLAIIAFFVLWFIPISGLDRVGQKGLAVIVSSAILWIFMVLPLAYTSMIIIVAALALKVGPPNVVLAGFVSPLVWLVIFSFMLTRALESCGLSKRIGLFMMTRFKKLSFKKLVVLFIALLYIGNLFVPSVAAYIVVMMSLVIGVLEALGQPKGERTQLSAGLCCFLTIFSFMNGKNILSALIGNVAVNQILIDITGEGFTWTSWLVTNLPMIPLLTIGTYFYVTKVYKPDVDFSNPELMEKLKVDYKALGPLSSKEIKTAILFVLVLILWIFNPGNIGVPMATGIVAVLTILPGIEVITVKDFSTLNYPIFIFTGVAVSIASIMSFTKLDVWLATLLNSLPVFSSGNTLLISITILLILVVTHLLFETLTQISLFFPVLLRMNVLPPRALTMVTAAGVQTYQFVFQATPIALNLGFGVCNPSDIMKYGIFATCLSVVQHIIAFAIGWPF